MRFRGNAHLGEREARKCTTLSPEAYLIASVSIECARRQVDVTNPRLPGREKQEAREQWELKLLGRFPREVESPSEESPERRVPSDTYRYEGLLVRRPVSQLSYSFRIIAFNSLSQKEQGSRDC
jgi:hypothetical protein